jgi:cyclopropane-fatty-acyl-phospholipid synthase
MRIVRTSVASGPESGTDGAERLVRRRAGAGHWIDRWCLDRIGAELDGARIVVRLWNGLEAALSDEPPVASVLVRDRATLLRLVVHPELAFGEGYADGRIEVQGDLTRLFDAANRAFARRARRRVTDRLARIATGASPTDARRNIHRHYDLGNEFYRLWLDDQLVYTCAYFERPDDPLEYAQAAKLDYVCRKLHLKPGEEVVEAGCGWGALALHMARHYGVRVRAFNISGAQLAFARERATREGLSDRVSFIDGDYRTIDGRCDAFVSIGMLEHVGPRHFSELGAVIDRTLDPASGRGLLHFIGRNTPMPFNAWTTRYIFPGAYAPTLGEVAPAIFEHHGLSVTDVENLRLHYAATLEQWQRRFEAQVDRVRRMFDERFVRIWRMYLATARAGFLSGDLQLFQIVFGRATRGDRPETRSGLYEFPSGTEAGGGSAAEP